MDLMSTIECLLLVSICLGVLPLQPPNIISILHLPAHKSVFYLDRHNHDWQDTISLTNCFHCAQ